MHEPCHTLQGAAIFEEKLLPLYMNTYQDQVNAVRMAATKCLHDLAKSLGATWVRIKLVPRLHELYFAEASSYLQRITVLYGIKDIAAAPAFAEVTADLIPVLARALKDDVPNVRFVACQILAEAFAAGVIERSKASLELRPSLDALAADSDPDVKFFAARALERFI